MSVEMRRSETMDFDEDAFIEDMDDLVRTLPRFSELEYDLFDGNLRIVSMRVPETGTGVGRRFRERLLELTDRYGLSTSTQPDGSGEPGEPSTFELTRFYARFGYVVDHIDRDAFVVEMTRAPRPPREGVASIAADYEAGKAADLTIEAFEAMRGTISKYAYDTTPSVPSP